MNQVYPHNKMFSFNLILLKMLQLYFDFNYLFILLFMFIIALIITSTKSQKKKDNNNNFTVAACCCMWLTNEITRTQYDVISINRLPNDVSVQGISRLLLLFLLSVFPFLFIFTQCFPFLFSLYVEQSHHCGKH